MNTELSSSNRVTKRVRRWREQYNPLRGLALPRGIALLEAYPRGEMADLQWTYYFVEQTDPDLFALVERRTSALLELDWNIKVIEGRRPADGSQRAEGRGRTLDQALAEEQAAALREAYERIDNLYEAIEHLALATFRGFAHLEKHHGQDGRVTHLEICDQWNVVRDGLRGAWKYNPEARAVPFAHLGPEWLLDPGRWIIREVKRHVNRIGLIKFIRQSLGQKDWDAFIEIYGLPGVVVVGPANVPASQEALYQEAASEVANGSHAYLPYGSTVHFSSSPRGANPFADYLRYLTEQLVLAGTGGLLTMLTASGSGTLAGHAHENTFTQIARGEARQISEVFQQQFDTDLLQTEFPGRPVLAYFELAAREQTSVSEVIDHAVKLRQAGFPLDLRQLSEKTGYRLGEIRGA